MWISIKQLKKRWHDAPSREIREAIEKGLPVYQDFDRREPKVIQKDVFIEHFNAFPFSESWQSSLLFKLENVIQFEENHGLFVETDTLSGKERTELGRLRREKENWDKTTEAAVIAGIAAGRQGRIKKSKLLEVLYKLELPQTSFEKIWRAIPGEHKTHGRPTKV